jgi:hypothetical protein
MHTSTYTQVGGASPGVAHLLVAERRAEERGSQQPPPARDGRRRAQREPQPDAIVLKVPMVNQQQGRVEEQREEGQGAAARAQAGGGAVAVGVAIGRGGLAWRGAGREAVEGCNGKEDGGDVHCGGVRNRSWAER